jgi:Alpha-L-arabinofuranosidase B (ABFB) domain
MSCSLMSEAIPGQYIRHQGFRAKLGLKADEQTKKDASFYSRPGLCGGPGYVSFESAEGFPGHFLKVRGGNEIWLEKRELKCFDAA